MFKCKKCGSEKYKLIEKGTATGLYCADCGFWHKWVAKKELYRYQGLQETKELSIGEKLYYIVRKGADVSGLNKIIDCAEQNSTRYFWGRKWWEIFEDHKVGKVKNILCDTIEQAIDTAFKAVKEKL